MSPFAQRLRSLLFVLTLVTGASLAGALPAQAAFVQPPAVYEVTLAPADEVNFGEGVRFTNDFSFPRCLKDGDSTASFMTINESTDVEPMPGWNLSVVFYDNGVAVTPAIDVKTGERVDGTYVLDPSIRHDLRAGVNGNLGPVQIHLPCETTPIPPAPKLVKPGIALSKLPRCILRAPQPASVRVNNPNTVAVTVTVKSPIESLQVRIAPKSVKTVNVKVGVGRSAIAASLPGVGSSSVTGFTPRCKAPSVVYYKAVGAKAQHPVARGTAEVKGSWGYKLKVRDGKRWVYTRATYTHLHVAPGVRTIIAAKVTVQPGGSVRWKLVFNPDERGVPTKIFPSYKFQVPSKP